MKKTYAVLGAGRQGTAAAYDMARWGAASKVILGDVDWTAAMRGAERVNHLLGQEIAQARLVDVTNPASVLSALAGVDAFLSAVPYYYNLDLTRIAIQARTNMADLGGNTAIVRQQHLFDSVAREAGISIIPDCGQVPGLGTVLCTYAMSLLDETVDIFMWDGGIPLHPRPPFQYLLTFHIAGLTNEYAEPAVFLRDWKITEVEPMTELETIEFPEPIGRLEAFVAGGGTSTMPWTFEGKLRTLQNLTLRYPGHFSQLRAYWDLGLWSLEPVQVGQQEVVPREVFHALFEPKVQIPGDKDVCIIRIRAVGKKDGHPAEALVELIDTFDDASGFSAMERMTGWTAAIAVEMAAHNLTPRGAGGVESFIPPVPYVAELRKHGLNVTEKVTIT